MVYQCCDPIGAPKGTRSPVRHSLQLWTVRDAFAADRAGTLRRLAEIGFAQVEPCDLVNEADELATVLTECGLTAPTAHAMLLQDDQHQIFSGANRLGVGTVVVPFTNPDHWQDPQQIRDIATSINAAARKGAGYGVRVGYHNHHWEISSRFEGRTALELFADLLDPEVVLEVDTYWAAVGGEDPAQLLARLGERVVAIHIKDGPIPDPSGEVLEAQALADISRSQLPAGQGDIDIWGVIAAGTSVEVRVVEFDHYAGDIFEGAAASLRYLEAGAPCRAPVSA
jgi:sugar phosphate isomerase/epimerase